jgi:hypothetical protein
VNFANAQTDIDFRLMEVYTIAWREGGYFTDLDEARHTALAALLRAAYCRGYADSLKDAAAGTPGKLFTDSGYPDPTSSLPSA